MIFTDSRLKEFQTMSKDMTNTINEKRPLAPTLRAMGKNDEEVFPRSQYSSIVTTKRRLEIETNAKFTFTVKDNCILVQRTE